MRAGEAAAPGDGHEVQIEVRRILSALRRHRKLAFVTGAIVFALGAVVVMLLPREYSGTMLIGIDPRKQAVTSTQPVLSNLPDQDNVVDSEVAILRSRPVALEVVRSLGLIRDDEFNASLRPPSPLASIRGFFSSPGPRPSPAQIEDATAGELSKGVTVSRVGLTYVIEVRSKSADPVKAARIANAIGDAYLSQQVGLHNTATQRANAWIGRRLADLRGQVLTAEAAVEQYKIQNNLLSTSGVTLTEQEISELNKRLAEAQTQEAESEARLATANAQLRGGSKGDELAAALDSTTIGSLRESRAEAAQRLARAAQSYGPRHPTYLKAKDELDAIDQQIQSELNRIIANYKAQVAIARQRTASVASSLGTSRSTLASNNRADVRLNELDRNAQAARTLYESFLQRYRETASQEGLPNTDARIVSPAQVPIRPSSVPRWALLAVVLLASVVAGLAAVLLRRLADSSLATSQDVETRLGLPALVSIPKLASGRARGSTATLPADEIVENPRSAFSESMRALRSAALKPLLERSRRATIAFTSALPGEGKSTAASCLGRSLALSGVDVVMVDCDIHRRALAGAFGMQGTAGMLDVVAGRAPLDSVIQRDERTGAALLLAGRDVDGGDVFATDAFRALVEQLKARFTVVIFDTPPVLALAEARTIAALADVTVHVVHWRKTPWMAVRKSLDLLTTAGANVAGVALGHVDLTEQARSGYGDAGYYYAAYKTYYAA